MKTYYVPGAHIYKPKRQTLAAKLRLWKRRRKMDDLSNIK